MNFDRVESWFPELERISTNASIDFFAISALARSRKLIDTCLIFDDLKNNIWNLCLPNVFSPRFALLRLETITFFTS